MNVKTKRRKFLAGAGGVFLGIAAGSNLAVTDEGIPELPWPYVELDTTETRKSGHKFCYNSNCASGVYKAIITQLCEKAGHPYTSLPLDLYDYGAGGAVGWGTLCGALNGAGGVITLVAGIEQAEQIVNELIGWYTGQMFPGDECSAFAAENAFYVKNDVTGAALPQSMSLSPLCHVSVTRWCYESGYASGSPERAERCARLTGDVAAKTVEMLNKMKSDSFSPEYEHSAETSKCLTCHAPGESFGKGQFTMGKMGCIQCHEPHPLPIHVSKTEPPTFAINGNYPNPFNPSTVIEFTTDTPGKVNFEIYNILGQRVRILISEYMSPGIHSVVWDSRDEHGVTLGQGMYIGRLTKGNRVVTNSMLMLK